MEDQVVGNIRIPNKSCFKSNEVSDITGVKTYVLRFWESEFEQISPITTSSGQRLYEHKDIEAIALIKKFLFEDNMTIERAKVELALAYRSPGMEGVGDSQKGSEVSRIERAITEGELQKLITAKGALLSMLEKSKRIKENHSWN